MSHKSRRTERAKTPTGQVGPRRWVVWAVIASGVVLALAVCMLVCFHSMRDAMGPRHDDKDHDHPPGPHGGTVVAIGRENRYHAEVVFERAGQVRVYTYGEDESQVFPIDAQPVPAKLRRSSEPTEFSILLSPEPQSGDPPGQASRFVGRLPRELDSGQLELVVPAMNFGAERHWFSVKSQSEWHRDSMPEKLGAEEERRLYLTPGGKYTEADIKANGGVIASEKFKGVKAEHDSNPKPGDRICPISRTKANPKIAWVIGGMEYLFCCPPCVDEFVRKAKEKPDEVKPPEEYLLKP